MMPSAPPPFFSKNGYPFVTKMFWPFWNTFLLVERLVHVTGTNCLKKKTCEFAHV